MQSPAQRVTGAVQPTGPQPANPAAGGSTSASTLATAETLGGISDGPASIAAGSSMNAKLGRVMLQNETIIALLARVVELLEGAADAEQE